MSKYYIVYSLKNGIYTSMLWEIFIDHRRNIISYKFTMSQTQDLVSYKYNCYLYFDSCNLYKTTTILHQNIK